MSHLLSRATYHAVFDESILSALKSAHELGFAGIQLAVESPHLSLERLSQDELQEVARFRQENSLLVSVHAPDEVTSLFVSSKPLMDGIFSYYETLFDRAEKIGAHLVTIHPGSPTSFRTAKGLTRNHPVEDEEIYRQAFSHNLQRLLTLADQRFVVALESYKWSPIVLKTLPPLLRQGQLALCWDLAKTWGDETLESFFWHNLQHVAQVHLHDIIDGKSHMIVGKGEIDFRAYSSLFRDGIEREYCFEVRPKEAALQSLSNLRKLLSED